MASPAKLTVDFRPTKRIKKRRELDALVSTKQRSLGRSGRTSISGRSESLWDESETSEMEEFDTPAKVAFPKRNRSCSCSTCFGVGCGVLLASFLISISVLVWMYVQLRRDVAEMQTKLAKVEDLSHSFPSQLRDLSSVQSGVSQQLHRLSDDLADIRGNITTIVNQVAEKTKRLARNEIEDGTDDEVFLEQLSPKFSWLEKKLSVLNSTIHRRLEEMKSHSALVDVSVSGLTNYTLILNKRIRLLEVPPGGARASSSDEPYHVVDRMLQTRIGLLNATIDALSDKLDAVLSYVEKLHNSTNSNIRTLNLTIYELSARLKLMEVTVHMMLSDSIASEATPGGKDDPHHQPQSSSSSSAMKRGSTSPHTTESNTKNQMRIGRSSAVLQNLPRS